jgi:hypothetical protein
VQVTLPSEEDLSAFTNPTTTTTTTSSSSSTGPPPGSGGSSWSSAAVYSPPPAGAAAAGGASGGSVGADLEKKAAVVVVFEGQTLGWTLTLTNISTQPITGCKVCADRHTDSCSKSVFVINTQNCCDRLRAARRGPPRCVLISCSVHECIGAMLAWELDGVASDT